MICGMAADSQGANQKREPLDLRSLIDTIPVLLVCALPDGSVEFVNRAWREYTGSSCEFRKDWGWESAIHPAELSKLKEQWDATRVTGQSSETETRLRRADGEYHWFLIRNVPLRDQTEQIVRWIGTAYEIEGVKRAEDQLRLAVETAPALLHTAQPDGWIDFFNRNWLRYLGLSLEDVQGWKWTAVIHPEDAEGIVNKWRASLASGEPFLHEARVRRADGKYRWMLHHKIAERDKHGKIVKWYGSSIDIEARKHAEDGLQKALHEVKKLKDQLYKENIALREEIDKASMFEEIVGTSPALRALLSRVSKVAPADSTVLVTGETGTGKELIARAIHKRSQRSSRAFVAVNCAAIPRDLIASELFGHEKGSFTGATQQRLGRFELAEGGTIFLDEVGELPAGTQIALLRVLQEHEFERVGGTRSIHSDVRVIAAANRDLPAAIAAGSFRSDLFYRLNVFPIEIPPLRQRQEDIPLLVEYFIDRYARKAGKSICGVSKKTLDLLQVYPWPGNIRELQNVIERSVIVCDTENFSVDPSWLSRQPLGSEPRAPLDLSEQLAAQEKAMIEAALRESGGRVYGPSGAAAKLRMPRSTLESKIRSLKINKNRFKLEDPPDKN
jgi:PAS domain S-box-containing protein